MDKFIEYDDLEDEPMNYKSERMGEFLEAQRKAIEENYVLLDYLENQMQENQRIIDELIIQICELERKIVIYGKLSSYIK